jgi:YD repeat-containing protein
MTFISDADIYDPTTDQHFSPTGWLLMADGTRYRLGETDGVTRAGLVTKIIDRNGNLMTFTYDDFGRVTTITDSLNRQVTFTYDLESPNRPRYQYDWISYKGFGGTDRSLKVWRTNLGRTLRAGFTVLPYSGLFPAFGGTFPYDPTGLATAVELPDGRTYELRYNPYGELARVELPTGGAIEYDHDNFPGTGYTQAIHRRVTKRRVYTDKATNDSLESEQIFSHTYTTSPRRAVIWVKQYDASDNMLSHDKHYFEGNPVDSLSTMPTHYSLWSDGREWKTEALSLNETGEPTALRRNEMTWQQSDNMELDVWWSSGGAATTSRQ